MPRNLKTMPVNLAAELDTLAAALELGVGRFSLLLAVCDRREDQIRLSATLRERLPDFRIQEVHFRRPILHLLDELRAEVNDPPPSALFVSGLEHSVSDNRGAGSPLIANLNAARNSFPAVVSCPLLLWVPEFLLAAIAAGAPDFFSVRSGVRHFSMAPEAVAPLDDANLGLSAPTWGRYQALIRRRRDESLTGEEHAELIGLSDRIEDANAQRISQLAELPEVRGVTRWALMDELGMPSHADS